MTLSAGTRLGPYEILAPIGAGGMGEVYRARDMKLDRDVAIKVLPPSVAADPDTLARFEREAKAVAALSHQNILSIFDFGTQDGVSYAVMELLEGKTLRGKLDGGMLAQKQAVDYALQIARGLSAAHEKGVVHRDLKPENVFVSKDGHVKILDFGLAKKVEPIAPGEETSAPTASGRTQPGTVMGTVGYMSPEQVRGLPVDHRSDIFSFGAILYELLSGKRAFRKDTAADTMSAILREEPPELSETGRNISPALDHIVKHCLEKDRDNRFQTARDVAFNLSEQSMPAIASGVQAAARPTGKTRILVGVVSLIVLGIAGILFLRRFPGDENPGAPKRVAVLPFENLGSPEDDYFADGITDEIRSKLTSLPGVEVIARGSSTPYKKTTKTPKQIAQELDVKYLLTATVRWQKGSGASRVHVTPELVEVRESGTPASKWQQPFDAALTDVFQVQADIASRVAQALGGALGVGDARRLEATPTQNLAAYDAFLKGEEAWHGSGDVLHDARKALGFYEQAVALDPGFAQAWARVSEANSDLFDETPRSELAEGARHAAEKAVALAPARPEVYLALGSYQGLVLHDLGGSLAQYAKGQRLAPENADLVMRMAVAEGTLGRWTAAVKDYSQAERLDPRSAIHPLLLGQSLLWLRRYREARDALDRGLAIAPAHLLLRGFRAMTFLAEGDLAGARRVFDDARKEVEPATLVAFVGGTWDLTWVLDESQRDLLLRMTPSAFGDSRSEWGHCLAQTYALKGDLANMRTSAEEARKAFEEDLRAAPESGYGHSLLGLAYAYLGDKEQAVREGMRGVALHPVAKDAYSGPYNQHQLARIYMLVGEPEKALDQLEPLLKIPYFLSPGWLKIDPTFDPLRKNPRFQKLVAGK